MLTRKEFAFIASLLVLVCFAAWFYGKGRQSGQQTAAKTVDKVVTQAVTLNDGAQVKTLQTQLTAARSEAAAFKSKLAEAARANPAPTDCRLPDGLRDDLNR
ncbi:outer membrane murein-binding lipoprotein Lpp [Cupriavidus metallidurans]|uniref:hypothetical protein n=1 Tax=Cupriavidus metallidurans TaxID=119219 RepID=UPI0004931A97|nr:hypothetical protein [Cupriavidus metallidurans]MDE4918284.1 hypothetical protein [Cupriavidus metallidurans]